MDPWLGDIQFPIAVCGMIATQFFLVGQAAGMRHGAKQERVEMVHLSRLGQWAYLGTVAVALALLVGCGDRDDSGASFDVITMTAPSAPGSMAPHLAISPEGHVVMSWLEPAAGDAHAVRYSVLQGATWSAPISVAEDSGWFVNWADFPSVVPITQEQWAAHWLVKRPGGTYSYNIAVSMSADSGATWAQPITPHTDNTPTEHGFVSMFPWTGGIGAVWLDGRNMVPDTGGKLQADGTRKYGGMTLRFARLGFDGAILDDGEVDNLVCDCCMTDVAMLPAGPVVVYRDRTAEEIRDISVARYANGQWSESVQVSDDNWKIPGCPVNGPAIVANDTHVVVAWYGAPNRESRVKVAWSRDAGQTFSTPIVIDDQRVSGRVDVALLPNGSAMVSWMGKSAEGIGQVRMREVTPGGELGSIHLITEGKFSRNTGFPQMIRADDRLVFAWPESGKPRQVSTAYLPLIEG